MSNEENTLKVNLRTRAGKGAARAERRAGNVPGVIYGDKKDIVMFSVSALELAKELRKPGFRTRVYEIDAEGEKIHAICQDIQRDLILNKPIHIDFIRVNKEMDIKVEVPLLFLNEDTCAGVRLGGTANIVVRELPVMCKPGAIPEHIEVDMAKLGLGDSLHLSSITLPAGVKPVDEAEMTLVTVLAPQADAEEAK